MDKVRLTPEQVQCLADDVRGKIVAKQDLIAEAEGEVTIRLFRRGQGWDIKLTITT